MSRPTEARRRALLSVSDKKGLVPFAEELERLGFELVSTGGTAALLKEAGLPVTTVSALTGFPEIMDGRVKTLHPAIHGGLLGRSGIDDAVAAEHGIGFIDLLVVNLYPFERTIAKPDCSYDDAIENIDIGGPAMIRAAAKNHERLTVVVDVADYEPVLEAFAKDGPTAGHRRALAAKAFAHTAAYDAVISNYLRAQTEDADKFPDRLILSYRRGARLRYGENPHQDAAVYLNPATFGASVVNATQLQGKTLSYNNLVDADAALQCVKAFSAPACVIVKHANPCGVAVAADTSAAYLKAYACDPTSAFGGVIAFNRPLDAETASAIVDQQFAEVIVAPLITDAALDALGEKPNIRVLACGELKPGTSEAEIKSLEGGLLLQDRDWGSDANVEFKVVTERAPSADELEDLQFAWTVARFVKSNAIVFAAGNQTLGIGAGQPSRVVSTKIAALKAAEAGFDLSQAAMASDAFFPFRDGLDTAAEFGIKAVIQPGGSMRDNEVVAAANENGMAMVFTGRRHFRH